MATSYMRMVTLTGNQFLNERDVWMGARGLRRGLQRPPLDGRLKIALSANSSREIRAL